MSKHSKKARSLEEVANPSQGEPVAVAEVSQHDSLTIVDQLESRRLTLQNQVADLDLLIQGGGDVDDIVKAVGDKVLLDAELEGLPTKIELAKLDEFNTELINGIQALIAGRPVVITKLYYELVTTEVEGVTSFKPMLQINDSISAFGKRKASSGSTSGGGNGSNWTDGKVTIPAKDLVSKLQADNPDVVKMLQGTGKAGAHRRVIESAQKRGYLIDWSLVT